MRRAAKVDSNHGAIVDALRAVGCSVQSLARLGDGVPDLLVGRNGRTWLLEVKDGARRPNEKVLTPRQAEWWARWRGSPPLRVESVADALAAVGCAYTGQALEAGKSR